MTIVVLAGLADSLVNFRGPLLSELRRKGYRVIACAPEAATPVADKLLSMGVEYRSVSLQRTGMNPWFDLIALRALWQLFRELKPDVVLGYTIKPVIYGSFAACIAGGSRIFSIITGLGYAFTGDTFKRRAINLVVRNLYSIALKRNKKVFFQNPDDLKLFLNLGLLTHREQAILINGSGVDIEHYTETPLPSGPISFLLIARLLRDKGIAEYATAAEKLKARYPQIAFRLLGPFDTNPSAIKQSQIENWSSKGIIEYIGETTDVRPYIAESSVYVLPSYREGTPRTVLEAMAMGRPVVTTDAPGCRETVRDGDNGFLVPAGDSAALAKAMERFILEPELICRMGRRSREIAVEKYDVHKVNAVIIEAMGLADEKSL